MKNNDQQQIALSGALLNQLKKTAEDQDHRSYSRLMRQVDWKLADAEQLDKAIGVALAFVDMQRVKQLTEVGLECFPDQAVFA